MLPLKTMLPDYGCFKVYSLMPYLIDCHRCSQLIPHAKLKKEFWKVHLFWMVCSFCWLTNLIFVCMLLLLFPLFHALVAQSCAVSRTIIVEDYLNEWNCKAIILSSLQRKWNILIIRGRLCFSLYQQKQTHSGSAENLYSLYSTQFDIPAIMSF